MVDWVKGKRLTTWGWIVLIVFILVVLRGICCAMGWNW